MAVLTVIKFRFYIDMGCTGAAYFFVSYNNVWSVRQKLIAADASANDGCGLSSVIHNRTIVVGANNAGIVHSFMPSCSCIRLLI